MERYEKKSAHLTIFRHVDILPPRMKRMEIDMQTIETHYLPVTNTKPLRVVAVTSGGLRGKPISANNVNGDSVETVHAYAAKLLRDSLGWEGKMIGGHTKRGMIWVFADFAKVIE